ncbi:GvpL/GvpF family gas vesicle protein [Streptomyces purpurogeneiscleroticus]|uniref:GvpL/GvpF family gas vesicle protein n=1 Tax=Streptomyces purpurogeneiscleroticus TaxID=68259 RepID=UPI001CC17021|nr:GvpL/GvpF family gas vesicle protein [Streptomyces purpurogeneiscleroticus]MBZ4014960.1 gas vesicle protein [Streptomyces purpurogeneiscleroticus]
MADHGLYVYAVIRSGQPLPAHARGVGGPPAALRILREGAIAAIVSDAPPQLRARRRDLLAHQELLLALSEDGPVLPMRFGVVAADERTLREQLAEARTRHLATLEQLAGRVEFNVKAVAAQNALAALVREDPAIRQLREDARHRPGYAADLRLGEAVATALARRAAEAGTQVVRELTSLAHAVAAGPEVQGCAVNASFLVARDDVERFTATARQLAFTHHERAELRLAGPLPCYSFVADRAPAPTAVT